MKKLVIAEKPSVARDLARVLGKVPKKDDYFENDEWVIDRAVGHLVELYMPDDFDPKLKSWKISNLPIIPPAFELKPIAANKKKFQQLKKQLKRKDIIGYGNHLKVKPPCRHSSLQHLLPPLSPLSVTCSEQRVRK